MVFSTFDQQPSPRTSQEKIIFQPKLHGKLETLKECHRTITILKKQFYAIIKENKLPYAYPEKEFAAYFKLKYPDAPSFESNNFDSLSANLDQVLKEAAHRYATNDLSMLKKVVLEAFCRAFEFVFKEKLANIKDAKKRAEETEALNARFKYFAHYDLASGQMIFHWDLLEVVSLSDIAENLKEIMQPLIGKAWVRYGSTLTQLRVEMEKLFKEQPQVAEYCSFSLEKETPGLHWSTEAIDLENYIAQKDLLTKAHSEKLFNAFSTCTNALKHNIDNFATTYEKFVEESYSNYASSRGIATEIRIDAELELQFFERAYFALNNALITEKPRASEIKKAFDNLQKHYKNLKQIRERFQIATDHFQLLQKKYGFSGKLCMEFRACFALKDSQKSLRDALDEVETHTTSILSQHSEYMTLETESQSLRKELEAFSTSFMSRIDAFKAAIENAIQKGDHCKLAENYEETREAFQHLQSQKEILASKIAAFNSKKQNYYGEKCPEKMLVSLHELGKSFENCEAKWSEQSKKYDRFSRVYAQASPFAEKLEEAISEINEARGLLDTKIQSFKRAYDQHLLIAADLKNECAEQDRICHELDLKISRFLNTNYRHPETNRGLKHDIHNLLGSYYDAEKRGLWKTVEDNAQVLTDSLNILQQTRKRYLELNDSFIKQQKDRELAAVNSAQRQKLVSREELIAVVKKIRDILTDIPFWNEQTKYGGGWKVNDQENKVPHGIGLMYDMLAQGVTHIEYDIELSPLTTFRHLKSIALRRLNCSDNGWLKYSVFHARADKTTQQFYEMFTMINLEVDYKVEAINREDMNTFKQRLADMEQLQQEAAEKRRGKRSARPAA